MYRVTLFNVSDGLDKVSNSVGKVSDGFGKMSVRLVKVSDGPRKMSDTFGKVWVYIFNCLIVLIFFNYFYIFVMRNFLFYYRLTIL